VKRLIVTADDAGLHRGMTAGVIEGHRRGIVTACSVVANGRAFDDAVERLRALPSLQAGVHLTLVEETSLTTGKPMPKNYVHFLLSMKPFDVERELRAQVEKVLKTGLRITHLNGHQHLHMLPRIYAIVEKLADEYRIGYVRSVNDVGGSGGIVRRLSVGGLSALGRRVDRSRRTIGVVEAGHLTAAAIIRLLDHVEGTTELVTHPGLAVDGYDWGYAWDAETAALCDPQVRAAIAERGIELITPSIASSSL
jgi:predicted glycoside hydrolase/deacetylase ChbG (UPF0249 family)